jgi:hypothetical protein
VRALIRRDQARQSRIGHMQALVDAGPASGKGARTMEALEAVAGKKAGV